MASMPLIPGLSTITSISTGIAAGKPLPGGGSTFNYYDVNGGTHAFSAENFLNFAVAIEGYVYMYSEAVITLVNGGSASIPSSSLSIA